MIEDSKIIDLKLDNLAYGGDCVGHMDDGYTVFVSGGIPGERVNVKLTEKKKHYARAEIVDILKPSPDRIEPSCKVFQECGGCQLQYMKYQAELKYKRNMIYDLLTRVGKINEPDIKEVIGADFPWYYRNKAQFPLKVNNDNKICAGFYRRGTHDLIDVRECKIQHPLINRIKNYTLELLNKHDLTVYDEEKHNGLLRHLVIRVGVCTNQAVLTLVTTAEPFPERFDITEQLMRTIPELTGVVQNINNRKTNVIMGNKFRLLSGEKFYTDYIGKIKYRISPDSFFQINTIQAQKLYDIVQKYCGRSPKSIIDCYCGTGSIGLYLADNAEIITGIEENNSAIGDAKLNAELNMIDNCNFICGKVEEELPLLKKREIKPDIVVFDPPRKGLKEEVVKTVMGIKPEKIIYVSCNPATLARDLQILNKKYGINSIQPVDMFPRTYHVECVVLMSRV